MYQTTKILWELQSDLQNLFPNCANLVKVHLMTYSNINHLKVRMWTMKRLILINNHQLKRKRLMLNRLRTSWKMRILMKRIALNRFIKIQIINNQMIRIINLRWMILLRKHVLAVILIYLILLMKLVSSYRNKENIFN